MIAARITASGTQTSSKRGRSFGTLYTPITEKGIRSFSENIKMTDGIGRRSKMKNYEKYAEEIRKYEGTSFCDDFIIPHIFNSEDNCRGIDCNACHMLQMIWLLEEYKEPEVNWSKVEVDTPILVRDNKNTEWIRRHFAKYED